MSKNQAPDDASHTKTGAISTIDLEADQIDLFVTSDAHFDSVYCDRENLFRDMDSAKDIGAKIILNGDTFDAMQGRFDPRRDMEVIRPEYRASNYYDLIVEDALAQFEPYAKNILLISPGNHELAVLKNANTFLSDRFVSGLNRMGGNVIHGGYGGFLRVILRRDGKASVTVIKYFHGSGGEAPVTRGAIQTSRQAVFLPDAEIVLNGHSHHQYWIPIVRERLSSKGVHYFDTQHHVRTPGYCMSYGDGQAGWDVTRGGVPKPVGGCFITIKYSSENKSKRDNHIQCNAVTHNPKPINALNILFDGIVFPQE